MFVCCLALKHTIDGIILPLILGLVNEKKKEGNGSLDPRSACPAQPRETAEVVKWGKGGGGQRG